MRGTVREGKGIFRGGGGKGRKKGKTISFRSYTNKWTTEPIENGKEEEGTGGRNKKKRLVMTVLSVTSFVDSHRVSMTTVKSLLESVTRH